MKSKTTALIFALFGCQYIYLGKIFLQILFWFTCGGLMIWYIVDLLRFGAMSDSEFEDKYCEDGGQSRKMREKADNKLKTAETIKAYGELYKQGLITEEEFRDRKLEAFGVGNH